MKKAQYPPVQYASLRSRLAHAGLSDGAAIAVLGVLYLILPEQALFPEFFNICLGLVLIMVVSGFIWTDQMPFSLFMLDNLITLLVDIYRFLTAIF